MQFKSFSGIRVLAWFLANPTRKIHFKELCRQVKLGPLTVKGYCEDFIASGWLKEERTANLRIFSLNDGTYVVNAIKKVYFLEQLRMEKVELIAGDTAVSFALYGSHASGTYDEKSDIDLLVVGRREDVDYGRLKKIELRLGKPIQLTIFSLDKWERNKKNDPFIASVLKNNVLIKGAPL
jgi:hypothetical protein